MEHLKSPHSGQNTYVIAGATVGIFLRYLVAWFEAMLALMGKIR